MIKTDANDLTILKTIHAKFFERKAKNGAVGVPARSESAINTVLFSAYH